MIFQSLLQFGLFDQAISKFGVRIPPRVMPENKTQLILLCSFLDDPHGGLAEVLTLASGRNFWLGLWLLLRFAFASVFISHASSVAPT